MRDARITQQTLSSTEQTKPVLAADSELDMEELAGWGTGPNIKLLDLTIDQMRTLVVVADEGNALKASKKLRRQQSTIQSQLKTLNERFYEICGERLCFPNGRNEKYVFSRAGQTVVQTARSILRVLTTEVRRLRQHVRGDVVVATTTYPQPFVWEAWNVIKESVRDGARLYTHQIRTRDVVKTLRSDEFDLVVAPYISENGETEFSGEWQFVPRVVERLAILTYEQNVQLTRPGKEGNAYADEERLFCGEGLIIPKDGMIVELLDRARPKWRRNARIHDTIDDVRYGVNLLRSGMAVGSMFVFEKVGQAAVNGTLLSTYDSIAPSKETRLKLLYLSGDFERFRIVTGLFARRKRLAECADEHPLRRFVAAFTLGNTRPRETSGSRPPLRRQKRK